MGMIELVVQVSPGKRVSQQATPESSLGQVLSSIDGSHKATSLRYVQTTVVQSHWDSTTLADLGLHAGDRALFFLEYNSAPAAADTTTNSASSKLQEAVRGILQANFDEDSKTCIVTLLKILDNVIQKPNNSKVRSIRLSNPVVAEKIVSRGGVDYLLACGFVRQSTPPPLLAKPNETGDECLVLLEEFESTSLLVQARRLLMQTAIQELHVKADDLPKYKPPPAAAPLARPESSTSTGFNPYQGHRHNTTGQPQQPDSYISTTETRLRQLQSQQDRLEQKLQGNAVEDREIVAFQPPSNVSSLSSASTTAAAPSTSDGSLLAQRMQQMEKERKEREEGGFTTKAMRDLEKMRKQKVYSHVKLRIQFPDGTALEAKFLPKEKVQQVKDILVDCFSVACPNFDLYVAPPRRQLDVSKTLQEEGLVPAAKCFVSWKGGSPPSSFIKPEYFQKGAPAYPTAKPVIREGKPKQGDSKGSGGDSSDPSSNSASREDDLLRRMMGGGGGKKTKKKPNDNKKSKWFKG